MPGQRLVETVSRVYGWLPRSLRRRLGPVAEAGFAGARRLGMVLSQIRLSVYSLRGVERKGGRDMTLLVLGSRRSWPYSAETVFSRLDGQEKIGRVFIWRVRRYLESRTTKPDLAVVHADELYGKLLRKAVRARLPEWVTFRFDLSWPLDRTWELAGNKNLRENLRRIRQGGFAYETTTDPARFDSFYREMYLPFIPGRFGVSTEWVGPRFMKLFFDGGLLLLVHKEGVPVSGSVIVTRNRGAKAMVIGVKSGSEDLVRSGALAACYYFTVLWAKENGFRSVDFGECRPFFDDGLFYFKKRWGMELGRYPHRRNVFGIWAGPLTPAGLDFLEGNPYVVQGRNGLEGRVLAGMARPLSMEGLRKILRSYLVPGLDRLVVVSPRGFESGVDEFAAETHPGRIVLIQASADTILS
jgi:hypothetical protein